MKNLLFKLVAILLLFSTFINCSSDSDSNSTKPITCPPGYTGPNCDSPITPTKIKITKIRIKQFPNSDGTTNWDFTNGPDIYIKLYKSSSLIFTSATYASNAIGDGSMNYEETFSPSFESNNSSSLFRMDLFDYDGNDTPSNPDDLMTSIYFSTYANFIGFPSSFNIQDSTGAFKAEVSVTYEW